MNSGHDNTTPDRVGGAIEATARELGLQSNSSRSIALMTETTALSTRELDQRRMIHRDDRARPQADAFRELRTRLLALGGDQNFVTMVASVSPHSGGSFVARNLAAAFAFDEAKTALLIDCNLRYASQHKALATDAIAAQHRIELAKRIDRPAAKRRRVEAPGTPDIMLHTIRPHGHLGR